jgi:hypothetical protein
VGKPVFAGFLAALALCSPASLSAQPAETSSQAGEGRYELPPRQFAAVDIFVDAIAIEDEAAQLIDSYWQPAIDALIAANPGKAELARSFGSQQRMAELSMFRPLVATILDDQAIELLNPDVRRRLGALFARRSAEMSRNRAFSDAEELKFAREATRIRSGPASRVNAEFGALAALARSPDGIALRDLYRRGLSWCVAMELGFPRLDHGHPECAQLKDSPSLARLRKSPLGEKLIRVNGVAYVNLVAMVQMAHDPGISLHLLLPAEKVEAAGLAVPADLSLEELVSRYTPRPGRPS